MDVLFYEVQMLNRVFEALPTANDVARNAALEVFLLHLRNLIDFFFEEPQQAAVGPKRSTPKHQKDDIRASHFRDNAGNDLTRACMPNTMPKRDINKRLSHMTQWRLKPRKHWPCQTLLMEMNQTIEQFIKQVADSEFPTKEGRTKQHFLNELSRPTVLVSVPTASTTCGGTAVVISSTP